MTLREAAERTSRSITTLRRYIRSGRLHAEKRYGRFGPEYFVAESDLVEAGLDPTSESANTAMSASSRSGGTPVAQGNSATSLAPRTAVGSEGVPMALFQELQLKHEQLLVQYGMVRASGLQFMELKADCDERDQQIERLRTELAQAHAFAKRDKQSLDAQLREAQLELEGRGLEVAALREKVRGLEMLTRNAVTNETIDKQFENLVEQQARVEQLSRTRQHAIPVPPMDPREPSPHGVHSSRSASPSRGVNPPRDLDSTTNGTQDTRPFDPAASTVAPNSASPTGTLTGEDSMDRSEPQTPYSIPESKPGQAPQYGRPSVTPDDSRPARPNEAPGPHGAPQRFTPGFGPRPPLDPEH